MKSLERSSGTSNTSGNLQKRYEARGFLMLISVQYLRGLAAVLVLIHHAIHKQGQLSGSGGEWQFGVSGVDLFFIISGFIMCHITARRETNARDFLWARVKRIIPLYWTLTLAALAVYIVSPDMVNSSGGTTTIINSFTLIPTGDVFLIQNGWTLSYEFLFYLVFAMSLWIGRDWRLSAVAAALVAMVALGALLKPGDPTLQALTGQLLLEFVMGIGAYRYINQLQHSRALDVGLFITGIATLVIGLFINHVGNRVLWYGLPYALLFAGFVSLDAVVARAGVGLISRVLKKIGDASYSIYLSHPFVFSGMGVVIRKSHLHMAPSLSIAVMAVTAVCAGYACHEMLELKLERWIRSLFSSPTLA
ncbi:acyltransferase family protein [Paraburkholderia xenovorans]|uniref:acyltransferase family protein n=1 Tax=Paraburkholderia xenovorans TaxID=36873 RepID=UPI003459F4EF